MDKLKKSELNDVSGGTSLDELAEATFSLYEKYQTVYAPNGKTLDVYKESKAIN